MEIEQNNMKKVDDAEGNVYYNIYKRCNGITLQEHAMEYNS